MANQGFRSRSAAIAPNVLDNVIANEPKKACADSVYETGASGGVTGQVSIPDTNAVNVKLRNVLRRAIKLTNLAAVDIYIGFSQSVTTITGDLLPSGRGNFIVIPYNLDVWAIAAGAGASLSYMEIADTAETTISSQDVERAL